MKKPSNFLRASSGLDGIHFSVLTEKWAKGAKRSFKKIKYNPNVLRGLLTKSRKIENSTENLGILFFNDGARYDVVKVCNPYCEPCAKAHPILEELVEKGTINLRIIFNASLDKDDLSKDPVNYFLTINDKEKENVTKKVLNDWYSSNQKDFNAFLNRFPALNKVDNNFEKIRDMAKWCIAEDIKYTPTIFINGHELPDEYSIEDLKEVLM